MGESAIERRDQRAATTWRITQCARRLADERGLDGFTMDDLAAAAEVSRRTLFNHVPGKVAAVLGPHPSFPAEALAEFRNGGPHGDLVLDLRDLADATLDGERLDREQLCRLRRLLRGSPKLLATAHERLAQLSEELVEQVQLREGPRFGRTRARVAIGILAALLDAALDGFLADPDSGRSGARTLADHFDASIRHARELFG